jgi:hypothetical protein
MFSVEFRLMNSAGGQASMRRCICRTDGSGPPERVYADNIAVSKTPAHNIAPSIAENVRSDRHTLFLAATFLALVIAIRKLTLRINFSCSTK